MTAPQCVTGCGRPAPDGYACHDCGITKPRGQLAAITDMTPAARDIAQGLSQHGGGTASGKPGSRLPLDLTATAKLDGVLTVLTKWIDLIGTHRGHARPWFTSQDDPLILAAQWLPQHLEWLRHRPEESAEWLADVAACARIVAGIAHGPSAQKYLGPCGATVGWDTAGREVPLDSPCPGDVQARPGAQEGACRVCGARWSTAYREAWLDGEVRSHAYRAAHIAEAYGINVNTIRSWATRGRLRSYWRTAAGITVEWTDPPLDPKLTGDAMTARLGQISDEIQARGGRLHYVGDVLDLAAADAARRAEEQAKRVRRAAEREAASTPA